MFSEVPDACSSSACCFVCYDSADVFWLSCLLCVLCTGDRQNCSLFFVSGFGDASKLLGPSVNAEVPIVYCQGRHCYVCALCIEDMPMHIQLFLLLFSCIVSWIVYANVHELPAKDNSKNYWLREWISEIVCVSVCL